jgi:hypothetical protein
VENSAGLVVVSRVAVISNVAETGVISRCKHTRCSAIGSRQHIAGGSGACH